jgi:Amt family ammonium transporter
MIIGYSFAFTSGSPFLGGTSRFLLYGMTLDSVNDLAKTIPESVYMCFQMTFAIITPALICGAFADRMKFSALLWFIGLWSVCVYCPIAHFVWGPDGFLNDAGVLDFAGGTVVHINSGFAGLMASRRSRCRRTTLCSASSALRCSGSAGSASTPARQRLPTAMPVWRWR